MYYEEKMIAGVMHWRGTPDGEWKPYTLEELSRRYAEAQRERESYRKLAEAAVYMRSAFNNLMNPA